MPGPLAGVRVVVTRAAAQAAPLVAELERAGAEVASLPLLEVAPPEDGTALERARRRTDVDWIVFTSANAVAAWFDGPTVPPGSAASYAVVGHATAEALRRRGSEPDLVATRSSGGGLLGELLPRLAAGQRVLLPQAEDARPELLEGLRTAGIPVEAVVAYRKRLPPGADDQAKGLFGRQPLGWVTFTSPSTVRRFREILGDGWEERKGELLAASIGPTTSAELRRCGIEPRAEAATPGAEGLVAAIVRAVTEG